jgi:Putative Flp pilus-assembly TadE/G-like
MSRTPLKSERGQVFAFSAISMVALLGMAAFVLDVGAWFRADRQIQSVADAAALAGAQRLPGDPGAAIALAREYAETNGGPEPTTLEVTSTKGPNDTIVVEMEDETPGFMSRVFGIEAVDIGSRAVARAALPGRVRWVAPIVVNEKHPKLNCDTGADGRPKPCAGPEHATTLEYYHLKTGGGHTEPDGAGSFGFVDFTGEGAGTSELKAQIAEGYDQYIAPGTFTARTGNPFSAVQEDLDVRTGDELLFPIYRKIVGTGSTAKYEIIGFVGFVITSLELHGSEEILHGYFTSNVVWDAIEADGGTPTDYGVRTIVLSE